MCIKIVGFYKDKFKIKYKSLHQSCSEFMKLHYWLRKDRVIILIYENEEENERLKKALIHAYKALERRYIENLKEIEKINSKLLSM